MDTRKPSIGTLEVTVRFTFCVDDLTHYEAGSLAEAAENLELWYEDVAYLLFDISGSSSMTVVVSPLDDNGDVKSR
jgi:hypothetical protein